MSDSRLDRLRGELAPLDAATFLVTHPVNVRYLTGFESSNAALLIRDDRVLLLTDGRYAEAARAVEGVELIQATRDIAPFLGERLAEIVDPPVAFESGHVTYAAYEALARSGIELLPAAGVVERLRAVKDAGELEAIRRAAKVTDAAYERLSKEAITGKTEAEVAWWLEAVLHDAGADGVAFQPIVGSGPNAALPHHHPGNRKIGLGETVLVDMGAMLGGYFSDCTRTFATGELSADLWEAYGLCRDAQTEALEALRPGAAALEVDALARGRIRDAGHEVLHGLGHGVGLEIHEQHRLSDTSDAVLASGNVVTVEPGVYLAGRGGIRIEDLVIVGPDGPEVLSSFTKELVVLE